MSLLIILSIFRNPLLKVDELPAFPGDAHAQRLLLETEERWHRIVMIMNPRSVEDMRHSNELTPTSTRDITVNSH